VKQISLMASMALALACSAQALPPAIYRDPDPDQPETAPELRTSKGAWIGKGQRKANKSKRWGNV
jgi:hypothetical protein